MSFMGFDYVHPMIHEYRNNSSSSVSVSGGVSRVTYYGGFWRVRVGLKFVGKLGKEAADARLMAFFHRHKGGRPFKANFPQTELAGKLNQYPSSATATGTVGQDTVRISASGADKMASGTFVLIDGKTYEISNSTFSDFAISGTVALNVTPRLHKNLSGARVTFNPQVNAVLNPELSHNYETTSEGLWFPVLDFYTV